VIVKLLLVWCLMHLRNQVKEEQLLFGRKREQKSQAVEKNCGAIMAEEINGHVNQPQRRVLGDYTLHQRPRHFSSIAVLNPARAIEIKPAHLTLVSANQFT